MKKLLVLLAVPPWLAACAVSSTPGYDPQFGDAVRQARQRQTLHPDAGTAAAVQGLEGRTVEEALTLYRNSFRAPPPVVNVINLGGTGGGR